MTTTGEELELKDGTGYSVFVSKVPYPSSGKHTVEIKIVERPENMGIGVCSSWEHLKKHGSRLGGQTGRYFLRFIGYDTPIFSVDVVAALVQAEVVDKEPTSKKAQLQTQDAFNAWRQESGRSLKEISRVLAMSTG